MATTVRIKVHKDGIRELLRSAELRDNLTTRMHRVLARAEAGARPGVEYVLEQGTTDRARVSVGTRTPGALFQETATGHLARCLDAAGGA